MELLNIGLPHHNDIKTKGKHVPYKMRQYCMAHRTNLVVQPLFNLLMVAKLENLRQSLYSYFSSSPKWHLTISLVKLWKQWDLRSWKMSKFNGYQYWSLWSKSNTRLWLWKCHKTTLQLPKQGRILTFFVIFT